MAGEFCQKKDEQGRRCILAAGHSVYGGQDAILGCKFWVPKMPSSAVAWSKDPAAIAWAQNDRENDERRYQVAGEMELARLKKENEVLRASRVYWIFSVRQMIEKGDVEGMKLNAQNNEDFVRDLQQQRDNLRRYTRHLDTCSARLTIEQLSRIECTCGLEQVLNPKART